MTCVPFFIHTQSLCFFISRFPSHLLLLSVISRFPSHLLLLCVCFPISVPLTLPSVWSSLASAHTRPYLFRNCAVSVSLSSRSWSSDSRFIKVLFFFGVSVSCHPPHPYFVPPPSEPFHPPATETRPLKECSRLPIARTCTLFLRLLLFGSLCAFPLYWSHMFLHRNT